MPRFRPRLSLLSVFLLMTIVALAMTVILQWRAIVLLRAESRGFRQQLGQLSIDNPSRAYAIRVRQPDPNLWRWRVYLPSSRTYRLMSVEGSIPPRKGKNDSDWIAEVKQLHNVGRSEHSGVDLTGEITAEASLFHKAPNWRLTVNPGDSVTEMSPSLIGDWLGDITRIESTEGLDLHQRDYGNREPLILLQLEKPVLSPASGGGTKSSEPTTPEQGIVLWLEPK